MRAAVKPLPNKRNPKPVFMPTDLAERLNQFMLDNRTGNVKIHIRDGQILGLTVEEKLSAA